VQGGDIRVSTRIPFQRNSWKSIPIICRKKRSFHQIPSFAETTFPVEKRNGAEFREIKRNSIEIMTSRYSEFWRDWGQYRSIPPYTKYFFGGKMETPIRIINSLIFSIYRSGTVINTCWMQRKALWIKRGGMWSALTMVQEWPKARRLWSVMGGHDEMSNTWNMDLF